MTLRKTFLALALTVMCAGLMFAGGQNRLAVDAIDSNHPVVLVPQSQERTVTNPPSTEATLYSNGPLVTHPGGGFGGADASALESPLTVFGFGHQGTLDYSVADDFTVTDAGGWTVDELCFYAYQTGSTTASTITQVDWTIWDGDPSLGGATAVCSGSATVGGGTLVTGWSGIYRTLTTDIPTANTRPIMLNTVSTGGCVLAAGTYWVEWSSWGTLASGPWCPPVTILGTYTTGDGLQNQAGIWVDLLSGSPTTYAQGVPLEVKGTVNGGSVSVDVSLFPQSGDGSFEYTLEITNSTGTSQTVDIWTELFDPHGAGKEGKVMIGKILQGDETYSRSGTSELKENAPLGDYTFVVNAGTYPSSIIASASAVYMLTSLSKREFSIAPAVPLPGETALIGQPVFGLAGNYPNPFNPSTTIRYALSVDSPVSVCVYNMLGQEVATLVDEFQKAGAQSVVWHGVNNLGQTVASGLYIYRLQAGNSVMTRKMLFAK